METLRVLYVLLLCSVSRAELQDNEVIEQRKVIPEMMKVSEQPQPCPSDIHTVLREISVKLAVLQSKMETLQTLNQEHTAKLTVVDSLKQQQDEQAVKLRELQTKTSDMQPMKEQLRVQDIELSSIKTWANVTTNQVESLRNDRAVGQVAFSASLLASGSGYTGPYNVHITLVFRHVISNIGNAYNPNTGIFTAPVRGAYHFEYSIYAIGGSSASVVGLGKNGRHILVAYEHQTNGGGTAASGATLQLEAGDVVSLLLMANTRVYDSESHYTVFSGHLLFPM